MNCLLAGTVRRKAKQHVADEPRNLLYFLYEGIGTPNEVFVERVIYFLHAASFEYVQYTQ